MAHSNLKKSWKLQTYSPSSFLRCHFLMFTADTHTHPDTSTQPPPHTHATTHIHPASHTRTHTSTQPATHTRARSWESFKTMLINQQKHASQGIEEYILYCSERLQCSHAFFQIFFFVWRLRYMSLYLCWGAMQCSTIKYVYPFSHHILIYSEDSQSKWHINSTSILLLAKFRGYSLRRDFS